MPLVRIDLMKGRTPEARAEIADVVYRSMMSAMGVPKDDRFMVISERGPGELIADQNYLGVARSADVVIIQVTLNVGRTVEQKKAFYKAVADGLHERANIRKEDVFIGLVEVVKENWSFGNGEAQYAK
jgi:4-oxalocrotonate tautomerase